MTTKTNRNYLTSIVMLVLAGILSLGLIAYASSKVEQRTVQGLVARNVPMHSVNQCIRMEAYNLCLNAHRGVEDKTSEALRVYACQDGALMLARRITTTIPTECLGPPEK